MSILSYDLPEVEGVTIHRVPLGVLWQEPEGLTIRVTCLSGTAETGTGYNFTPLPVALDTAHDLSWRGPDAYVYPEAGDYRGVTHWRVEVLGFIEAEALDALDAVRAAMSLR
jgi:hypothetical protein